MALDDFFDAEVGIAAAAAAAAVSPRARELARKGAVYGLAGALRAGDTALAAARGAVQGARTAAAPETNGSAPAPRRVRSAAAARRTSTRSSG
ncbi:MAG: hypothetical protein NVS2B6_16550 [Thermoleophilaceae bacterium]